MDTPSILRSLLTLLSFYFLLPLYEGNIDRQRTLLAGIASGLAVLFRYDIGFSIALAELLVGCVFIAVQTPDSLQDRRILLIRFSTIYAIGFAIPVLPVAVVYIVLGAAGAFWFDVVYWGTHYYIQMRSLPFPPISLNSLAAIYSTAVYLPPAIWLTALFCTLGLRGRAGSIMLLIRSDTQHWVALQLLVLCVSLFLKGIVRIGPGSVTIAIVSSFVLLAVIAGPQLVKGRIRKAAAVGGVLLAGCFTAAPLAMALSQTAANLQWAREELLQESRASGSGYGCRPPPGLGRLACLETGKDNVDAVQYVQTITKPEDYLFVGAGRHDKIFANNILFYFLANRRPATKWHHFDPGLQTSAEIQREIITELETKRPPVVVLDLGFDSIQEPNASAQSSGVVLLDQYLHAKYREQRRFGYFVSVLTRLGE